MCSQAPTSIILAGYEGVFVTNPVEFEISAD